jgi:hypothetical protein
MARAPNIYNTNPYPVDPAFAMIGQNLGTALFGNPEMAAQAKLRRAQAEAQAAAAGYDTERTRGERDINDARVAWSNLGVPGAIARGNPGDFTPNAYVEGMAGLEFLRAAGVAVPGMEAAPASDVGSMTGLFGGSPAEAAPAVQPALTETQARLLGAILGNAPTVTTAYTEAQGDDYQAADLANKFKANMNKLTQAERAINASSMTAEAKREQLDKIRKIKTAVAQTVREVSDKTILLSSPF